MPVRKSTSDSGELAICALVHTAQQPFRDAPPGLHAPGRPADQREPDRVHDGVDRSRVLGAVRGVSRRTPIEDSILLLQRRENVAHDGVRFDAVDEDRDLRDKYSRPPPSSRRDAGRDRKQPVAFHRLYQFRDVGLVRDHMLSEQQDRDARRRRRGEREVPS